MKNRTAAVFEPPVVVLHVWPGYGVVFKMATSIVNFSALLIKALESLCDQKNYAGNKIEYT